jgi:hypothetical protein
VRLRAKCHLCLKDFMLLEAYNATRHEQDRCPSCGAHLGVPNLSPMLRRLDVTATVLLADLRELADRGPVFSIDLEPLVGRLDAHSTPSRHSHHVSARRRRRQAA